MIFVQDFQSYSSLKTRFQKKCNCFFFPCLRIKISLVAIETILSKKTRVFLKKGPRNFLGRAFRQKSWFGISFSEISHFELPFIYWWLFLLLDINISLATKNSISYFILKQETNQCYRIFARNCFCVCLSFWQKRFI